MKLARQVNVLATLSWPRQVATEFLAAHDAGRARLPQVPTVQIDLSEVSTELELLARSCDPSHPIGRFLSETAQSYFDAASMLQGVGTARFRALSESLYGSTLEKMGPWTIVAWADHILKVTSEREKLESADEQAAPLDSEAVARELKQKADGFFIGHDIQITVDANLVAMAAAGAGRVRIRGQTHFTKVAVAQLLEHELLVHSATMINGRNQPYLRTLGLAAPRTTTTQEGLATFAEIVTGTMDVARLRRIALRIKATHRACEGDDFIGVFRFFLAEGQSPQESFHLAARIFRGGNLRGLHVFTKDVVYLKGLFLVQRFIKRALDEGRFADLKWLFAGRLTVGDVASFLPYWQKPRNRPLLVENEDGFHIKAPQFVPPWLDDTAHLAERMDQSILAQNLMPDDLLGEKSASFSLRTWQVAG